MKKEMGDRLQRMLTGFAAGVMVAASIWSLLIPAMEQVGDMGKLAFVPAVAGFWLGILFLLLLDHIIPHLHRNSQRAEGPRSQLKRTTMLVLAVTLHNIPEGMAVGVVYAGVSGGQHPDFRGGRDGAVTWNRNSEFPGGGDYFHAASGGGNRKAEGILRRRALGDCGADRGDPHDSGGGTDCPGTAVSAQFCGGSNALCGRRGTDSGDVAGEHSDVGTIFFAVGFSVMMMLDVALG